MSSLADVFRVLNRMRDERIVAQYAVGGATAVLFYAEPTRTYDLDVFVTLEEADAVDRERLRQILTTHAIAAELPNDA